MGSHDPFGHLQYKLWQKERLGVKLAVWLLTTKSQESTRLSCVKMECNRPLERSRQDLQLCFRPHPDWRYEQEIMALQSYGSPTLAVSGLPFGSPETKRPFGCGPHGEAQRILYGGRWWLPLSPAVVSLMSLKSPVACPSTKGVVT
jgi:hypothetical protein